MEDEKKDKKLSIRSILFFDKKVEEKKIRRQSQNAQQEISENPNEISFIELGEQNLAHFFPISKTKFPHVLAKVPKKGVGVYQTSYHFENKQIDLSILTVNMSLLFGEELTKFLELKLHQKICLICYEEKNIDAIEINKKIQIWKSANQSQEIKNSIIVVGLTHNILDAPSELIINLCEKESVLHILNDPSTNFLPVLKIAKLLLHSYDGNTQNFDEIMEKLKGEAFEIESNLRFFENLKVQKINEIWVNLVNSAIKLICEITNENETFLIKFESSKAHLNFVKNISLSEQKIKNLKLVQNHYLEEEKFEGTNSEEFQESVERVKLIDTLINNETKQLSEMKRNDTNLEMSYELMEENKKKIESQLLLLDDKIVEMTEFQSKYKRDSEELCNSNDNDELTTEQKVLEQNMKHQLNSKISLQTKAIGAQIKKIKHNLEEILLVLKEVMKSEKQTESKKEGESNLFKILVEFYAEMRLKNHSNNRSNQETQIDDAIDSVRASSNALIKEIKEFIEKYDEKIGQQFWSSEKLRLELRNRKNLIKVVENNWRGCLMKKPILIKKTTESSVN